MKPFISHPSGRVLLAFFLILLAGLGVVFFLFPEYRSLAPGLTRRLGTPAAPAVPRLASKPSIADTNAFAPGVVTNVSPGLSIGNIASSVVAGDGKDTNSIRKWAHNDLEVRRMLDENDKIYRRQLVTLKEPVAVIVERNRLTGAKIQELTLQGLDGQEIQFQVTAQAIEPSGLRGTFSGHVVGRMDSMVTLAYLQNRQAYTILSPADNLYLDVEPHDPGDVIVKSINLEKYGAGLCGTK